MIILKTEYINGKYLSMENIRINSISKSIAHRYKTGLQACSVYRNSEVDSTSPIRKSMVTMQPAISDCLTQDFKYISYFYPEMRMV